MLLTCRTFFFRCLKKAKAKFTSVALMYIQSTSFGISKLRFTPGKRGMGFIYLLIFASETSSKQRTSLQKTNITRLYSKLPGAFRWKVRMCCPEPARPL